jgi:RimJ/RimL family protein N-acetyltransferase
MYVLREVLREDLTFINKWRNNKEMIDLLGGPFRYINIETEISWYENYLLSRDSTIRLSICNANTNIPIGLVSLTNIDRINQSAVFHIMIGEQENRGKGAGLFATKGILTHAFCDMNINRVELTVLETNISAINFYSKIGFKQEGIKREAVFKNNKFVNLLLMSILKNDYKNFC